MVRDLVGTLDRERRATRDPNAVAVLLTAHQPTKGMLQEARDAGTVETFTGPIPAVQILSVEELFSGQTISVPAMYDSVTAAAAGRQRGKQLNAFIDPREIARQRRFFFQISGGKDEAKQQPLPLNARTTVMPERLRGVA
jgi:site-specific DNA-methyltransferase (adenine-specific)